MTKCKEPEKCPMRTRSYALHGSMDSYCFWACGMEPPAAPFRRVSPIGEIAAADYDPLKRAESEN